MASGHVNRIRRPNTWLHRPMLQNVKKALANPEPSTHGTKRTRRLSRLMSAFRGKADMASASQDLNFWTKADIGGRFAVMQNTALNSGTW